MKGDLARNPAWLETFLLGDSSPGAIERARSLVVTLALDAGPSQRTSSIIGGGDAHHGTELSDEGATPKVLELAVGLMEWRSGGIGRATEEAKESLVSYLHTHKLSDADYLLGSRKGRGRGLLRIVRDDAGRLLTHKPTPSRCVDRLSELSEFMRAWLGACNHNFVRVEAPRLGFEVYACRCGARYGSADGQVFRVLDAWLEEPKKLRRTG